MLLKDFLDILKHEKILIVGFSSKTGLAAACFFQKHGIAFSVSDSKDLETVQKNIASFHLTPEKIFAGEQTLAQLDGIHRVVIAPGVPRSIPLLVEASRRRLPVDSEIALACALLKHKKIILIGITGTDGKSTTTALTHAFFAQKYRSFILGNFGEPLINRVDEIQAGDAVVLELSSYQLEDGEKYRMNGSTILNVAPDHLNRYSGMEDYRKAKEKIFKAQTIEDTAVLNIDLPFYKFWKDQTRAKVFTLSLKGAKADLFYSEAKQALIDSEGVFLPLASIPLKGSHNLENIMTASALALSFGVSKEQIKTALKDFKGLEHRCEPSGTVKGIHFINDSKATTVQAVIRGLSSASGNLILILGGSDKNLDFSELNPYLGSQVKKVVCYGETGPKISKALTFEPKEVVFDFKEAFLRAVSSALPGDTVLLSPGCASFDQFQSYEERGRRFKELVREYEKQKL